MEMECEPNKSFRRGLKYLQNLNNLTFMVQVKWKMFHLVMQLHLFKCIEIFYLILFLIITKKSYFIFGM